LRDFSIFFRHFTETQTERPTLDGILFPNIPLGKRSPLSGMFVLCDIDEAMALYEGNKRSLSYEFHFTFITSFLLMLGEEFGVILDQL